VALHAWVQARDHSQSAQATSLEPQPGDERRQTKKRLAA
jgi:hypothetical protein